MQLEDDMLILQKNVDSQCDWSLKWQLKFNALKCTCDVWQLREKELSGEEVYDRASRKGISSYRDPH